MNAKELQDVAEKLLRHSNEMLARRDVLLPGQSRRDADNVLEDTIKICKHILDTVQEDSTQITREQMLGYAALGQIMSFHVNHQTGLFDLILHNGTRHQLIASPEDYALMSRLIRMSEIKPESLQKIIKRLKDISKGKHVWRVQNKTSKAYCIEFEDYEEHDAKQWWKSKSSAYPETYKESELARVHFLSCADKLIRSAVVMLKRLE